MALPPLSVVCLLSFLLCVTALSPDTREYLWHLQSARLEIDLAPLHAPPAALSSAAAAMAVRMAKSGSTKSRGSIGAATSCGASGILYTAGTKAPKWRYAGAVCAHLWRAFGMWNEIFTAGDFAAIAVKRAKDGRVWCVHLALNGVRYRGRKCKRDPNWFELRQNTTKNEIPPRQMAAPSATPSRTPRPSRSPTPSPSPEARRQAPAAAVPAADKEYVFRNKRMAMQLGGGRKLQLSVNCDGGPCRYCDVKKRTYCFPAEYSRTLDKSVTPTLPGKP